MQRRKAWMYLFPSLFATYPTLLLAASNPAEFWMGELILILGILVGTGAVLHLLVRLLLRNGATTAGVALVAAGFIIWIFCSNLVLDRIPISPIRIAVRVLTPVAVLGIAFLVVRRAGKWVETAARFLSIFIVVLIGFPAARLLGEGWRYAAFVEKSEVVSALNEIPTDSLGSRSLAAARTRPDIYLVILDQYAESDVLEERFGFNNAELEDSLRQLGFTIPRGSWSNYAWTAQSLASMLNQDHLPPLVREVDATEHSRFFFYHLIHHNRISRFLKEYGYTIYFQPTQRWFGTGRNVFADSIYFPSTVSRVHVLAARTMLASHVFYSTVVGRWAYRLGYAKPLADLGLAAFMSVVEVAESPGPKFVFLHSGLQHAPYFFDASCKRAVIPDEERAYIENLRCTNTQVLRMVEGILRRSEAPPIILLQGDHGPRALNPPPRSAGAMSREQVADRFGAFAAYHFPSGGAAALPDTVTPVNLFRFIFNHYFDSKFALRPNRMYYSPDDQMYQLVPVPDSLRPGWP